MGTDLTNNKSFEERMKDRIKDSIGDLITDEDLSKLVHRGVEEVFFKERKKTTNSWGNTITLDPLIYEIVKDLLEDKVRVAASTWINANPEKVQEIISNVVKDGVGMTLIKVINNMFSSELFTLESSINTRLQNGGL